MNMLFYNTYIYIIRQLANVQLKLMIFLHYFYQAPRVCPNREHHLTHTDFTSDEKCALQSSHLVLFNMHSYGNVPMTDLLK